MIKVVVTGDNHFGKKYNSFPEIREKLINSRLQSFKTIIDIANEEGADFLVITGDLFDNENRIEDALIKEVARTLSKFFGTVLVLPGNHDFYSGNEPLWETFKNEILGTEIIFLSDFVEVSQKIGDEEVVFYPALCDSKHSRENRLSFIKNKKIDGSKINIGIAHGAIKGLTPDINGEYFTMTEEELIDTGLDLWLLGHTHISYPRLSEEESLCEYKIFNPGTHEQTDYANNTEGNFFILNIEKYQGSSKIYARRKRSGRINFYNLELSLTLEDDFSKKIEELISDKDDNSIIRINISGLVKKDDYRLKSEIYNSLFERFLSYSVNDHRLISEINKEDIEKEFASTSFVAKFMEKFTDDPLERQMAYEIINKCKE